MWPDIFIEIRRTSLRRDYFSDYVQTKLGKDLQLIRDVVIRWSSTYLMVNRALDLQDENVCLNSKSKYNC